jgi:hypothetical protein
MRLKALEGWRGITALLVVLYHLLALHFLFDQPWLRHLAPVLDFFFIVSGFVMALGFSDKVKDARGFWSFLLRRAGRVWPLHLAMLSLLVLVPLLHIALGREGEAFWGWRTLDALWRHITLLQMWSPETALDWNYPAWTLSIEIFAYFIMALVLLVSTGPRMRCLLVAMVAITAGYFFLGAIERSPTYNVIAMSRGLTGFFLGFLVYEVWKRWPLRDRRVAHVLEGVGAALYVALLFWPQTGPAYLLVHIVYAMMIYVFASDLGFVTRLMSVPPLQWLGKVSFSAYMFHGVVTQWLFVVMRAIEGRTGETFIIMRGEYEIIALPEAWMNNALLGAYVLLVMVGAHFIYRWVEDPSRIYFAELSKRVFAKPAAAPVSKPSRGEESGVAGRR